MHIARTIDRIALWLMAAALCACQAAPHARSSTTPMTSTPSRRAQGLTLGSPEPALGQARVATLPDGTLVGIRSPLGPDEHPILRTYLVVADLQRAVSDAAAHGATIAYPPTRQGSWGEFAIVIQGGVEHGFWQR